MADKENEVTPETSIQQDDSFSIDETPSSWQGDLPPEDDFHDEPEAMVEEGDFSENESGEGEEEESSSEHVDVSAAAKKRGTMVALSALAGGGLLVALLVYLQFGAENGSGSMALPVASVMQAQFGGQPGAKSHLGVTQQAGLDQPSTPTTAEAEISNIYNAGVGQTVAPNANTVAIPGASEKPSSVQGGSPISVASSEIMGLNGQEPSDAKADQKSSQRLAPAPAAAPSASNGKADSVEKQEVASQKPVELTQKLPPLPSKAAVAAAAPVMPDLQPKAVPSQGLLTAPSSSSPAVEARLDALTSQIDALKKSMQQTASEASSLASKLDHQQAAPSGIEARLDKLEEQISALAAQKGRHAASSRAALASEGLSVDAAAPAPVASAHETKASKASSRSVAKHAHKKVVRHRSSVRKAAQKTSKKWVLRAATPDAAWIAPSASSPQLRQVQVGDTLPGIGRVKAIKQSGSRWVVVGARGSIR